MEVHRIDPSKGFLDEFRKNSRRLNELETKPSGNIVIRETLSTEDPETGVKTIIGQLPDGSVGFQPFIGDITPPPVATVPLVSAEPGSFVIYWDGMFIGNAEQPRDFEQVNIIGRMVDSNTPVPVGIIRKKGEPSFVSTDKVRPSTDWEFALQSEDFNGNKAELSAWSAPVTMLDAISSVDVAWTDMKDEIQAAQEKSAAAQTAAGSAQEAATKAAADALAASGIAAGKGKVLFQTTEPVAADRANTLWIDTTGGNNTPKRWNGTAWVAVTDKVAVDAAAKALAAETTASQAFNAATQAASSAGAALTAANGKNRNWYQTAAPAGTDHKDGDIWFDTDAGNSMSIWKSATNKWESIQDAAIDAAALSATAAMTAANGKNKVIWSTENATGTDYKAGDVWFKRNGTTGVIIGQWEFTTSWQSRTIGDETIANLNAGKLVAGFISADRIKSGSISVDKLLVSSTDNLVSDADFRDSTGVSWGGYGGSYLWDATAGRNGGPAFKIVNGATQQGRYNSPVLPTTQGNAYRVGAWVKSSVPIPSKGFGIYCTQRTLNGTTTTNALAATNAEELVANTWHYVSGIYTTVANATTMAFGVFSQNGFSTGEVLIDYVSATRASNGALIVDGSITSDSIATGQINSGHIVSGSIKSVHIASKSITTDKMVITSSDNMIIEPDFSNGGYSWQTKAGITFVPDGGRNGASIRFTESTGVLSTLNVLNRLPVSDNDRFRMQMWYRTSAAQSSGRLSFMIRCFSTATAYVDIFGIRNTANTTVNTWTLLEGQSPTLPLGTIAVEFYLRVQNSATTVITDLDYVSVTRANDASLIVDGAITASKLETDLVLATKIIAGDPAGVRAEMAPEGFKVFGKASGDTTSTGTYEIVRLGVADTNDMFAIADKDGITQASISENGIVSGKQVYASDDIVFKGDKLSDILWELPKGHIASAFRYTDSTYNARAGGEWAPYLRIEVNMERNRLYKISTSAIRIGQDVGGSATIRILQATGSVATISNGVTVATVDLKDWGDGNSTMLSDYAQLGGATQDGPRNDIVMVSYLLMFKSDTKQFGIRSNGFYPVRLMIEDMGPLHGTHTGVWLDTTSSNGVPPAAPPAKSVRTSTWDCNFIKSFTGTGAYYNYNVNKGYQGLSPAGYGNMKTIMKFPDMTGELSGSVIHSIRVYLYFEHWYYNAGGTARIALAGGGDTSTYTGQNPVVTSGGWPKPGGRWVTIPTGHYWGFQNGTYRGITLEGDGTYNTYGIAHPGKIEVTYTK